MTEDTKRAATGIGSALLIAWFVWIVFDSLLFGILAGLFFGGGFTALRGKK